MVMAKQKSIFYKLTVKYLKSINQFNNNLKVLKLNQEANNQ
jgi:LysM repeat protein